MKLCVDGIYREATPEEEASIVAGKEPIESEPTAEERIAQLEEQLIAAKILLGVE